MMQTAPFSHDLDGLLQTDGMRDPRVDRSRRFHLLSALTCSLLVVASAAGCRLTSISVTGLSGPLIGVALLCAMVSPLPAYWHQEGRVELRDAALMLPWALLLSVILPFPFFIAVRLGMPLQDAHLAMMDRALGFHSAGVVAWANQSRVGAMLGATYGLLPPLMLTATIVPALLGKPQAKRFFCANLIAIVLAAPFVALFPAVGPWASEQMVANGMQLDCAHAIATLRDAAPFVFNNVKQAGIVCFPSFHVVWAVLSASALWGFKALRVPVGVLAMMIVMSTLTTGWHYLSDVLGGLLLAAISLRLARYF